MKTKWETNNSNTLSRKTAGSRHKAKADKALALFFLLSLLRYQEVLTWGYMYNLEFANVFHFQILNSADLDSNSLSPSLPLLLPLFPFPSLSS